MATLKKSLTLLPLQLVLWVAQPVHRQCSTVCSQGLARRHHRHTADMYRMIPMLAQLPCTLSRLPRIVMDFRRTACPNHPHFPPTTRVRHRGDRNRPLSLLLSTHNSLLQLCSLLQSCSLHRRHLCRVGPRRGDWRPLHGRWIFLETVKYNNSHRMCLVLMPRL
jgi:hypothetical protein